jgi:cellulose synthase/poly-beta-1,6-N-acetylglucosamine synthase-like glycosyltransferase
LPVLSGLVYVVGLMAFVVGDAMNRRRSLRMAANPLAPIDAPRTSVIVPARNEAAGISACLESILACNWPRGSLELVVVDDHSTDGTADVVRDVQAQHPDADIRIIEMAHTVDAAVPRGHKKRAVAEAMNASTGEILLVTDADASVPPDWIRLMVAHLEPGVGCVAGPIAYHPAAGRGESGTAFTRWLGPVVALEYAGLQGIASGAIGLGRPMVSFGASSGYRREAIRDVGGFDGLYGVSSGDDALLMQRMAYESAWRVAWCAHPGAIVRTAPAATVRAFWQQRRRWITGTVHYAPTALFYSLAIYLFLLSLPMYAVGALFWPVLWAPLGVGMGLKVLGEGVMLFRAAGFFGIRRWWPLFLPAQPLQIAYIIGVVISGLTRPIHWKDRALDR